MFADAEQCFQNIRALGAHQSADAQYFAFAQFEETPWMEGWFLAVRFLTCKTTLPGVLLRSGEMKTGCRLKTARFYYR